MLETGYAAQMQIIDCSNASRRESGESLLIYMSGHGAVSRVSKGEISNQNTRQCIRHILYVPAKHITIFIIIKVLQSRAGQGRPSRAGAGSSGSAVYL